MSNEKAKADALMGAAVIKEATKNMSPSDKAKVDKGLKKAVESAKEKK